VPEALLELRNAIRLDPGLVPARNRLAWTLATAADPQLRDGREALALAEQTRRIAGDQAELLQTLAAAQAATGDFGAAAASAAQAIAVARADHAADLAARLEAQRRIYLGGHALYEVVRDAAQP
jgi:hypothetical protein